MQIKTKQILQKWTEYTLINDHNISVSILDYGATITSLLLPNREGVFENVVLGYKDYGLYEENPFFLGSVIGRVAGRVAKASFKLHGETYQLEKNDGENHLHGGSNGLHTHLWDAEPFEQADSIGVRMKTTLESAHDHYPGNVQVTVVFTLTNENELRLDYYGEADKETPLVLTNHAYFNLSGNLKDTVHDHKITFHANNILELDSEIIPTGKLLEIENTTFDFSNGRKLRDGIHSDDEQHRFAGNGYDHYFLFKPNQQSVLVEEESSGRKMRVETNQPGMVLYSGSNLMDNVELKERRGEKYLGVCFETQNHSIALQKDFLPSIIYGPNKRYHQRTSFFFEVDK